jgi:hypothetical protein
VKRGEVWTAAGDKDYAGKPRPIVIVQDDRFDATTSITICAFTSDPTDAPLFRLAVEPSEANGLETVSRLDGRQDHDDAQGEARQADRQAGRPQHGASRARSDDLPRPRRVNRPIDPPSAISPIRRADRKRAHQEPWVDVGQALRG